MDSSSDDDSSEESFERLENVKALLVKSSESGQDLDSECVFKRNLGDLIFDANFEGGNLGFVERIDSYTYDLMVRPDVTNPNIRLWFNFKISNQRPGQCVLLTIVNISDNLGLFNIGLTPVVRSRMYPTWIRLQSNQVFYYKSPNHSDRRVLTIAFKFPQSSSRDNEHQFALFFPYTITNWMDIINRWSVEIKRKKSIMVRLVASSTRRSTSAVPFKALGPRVINEVMDRSQSSLAALVHGQTRGSAQDACNKTKPNMHVEVLAYSVLSKPIYRLSVSNSELVKTPIIDRRLNMVILGGSSGNISCLASFICQGLLDFALGDDLMAASFRENINLIIFPMPDPDSVWLGNSRSDLFGQIEPKHDLLNANPRLYENLISINQCIQSTCERSRQTILIDLHVNVNLVGSRLIGTKYENTYRMERHLRLPRLLSYYSAGFLLENCEFYRHMDDTSLLGKLSK